MSNFGPDYLTTGKMTRAGLICVLTIIIFTTSCQNRRPSDVLSREDYAQYLVDVYLAEAKLTTLAVTPDSAMTLFQPFEQSLLRKYNKSDSVIQKTYQYYLTHPEQMEQVYTAVIDTLNLLETKRLVNKYPNQSDPKKDPKVNPKLNPNLIKKK